MFAESIDNEAILNLPRINFPGDIKVITKEEDLKHLDTNPRLKAGIIGFDTETKPSFKKGSTNSVALLQLASNDIALIIKVKSTGLPKILLQLLQNEKVLKIGSAIHDDIKSLQKIKMFKPAGFVDLQNFAKEKSIESKSVRKLAAIVLGVRVSKSQQLSNWESEILTEAQLQYAATDAWICREIYNKMITN